MDKIKLPCACGKKFIENEFDKHYKSCELFKRHFKDFDTKFGELLRVYGEPKENLLTIKFLLKKYVEIIDKKINDYFENLGQNPPIKINNNKYMNNNNQNLNELLMQLMKMTEIKGREIKNKNQEIAYNLKPGEELLPIIFISSDQKIQYSFICKNTDKFNYIENKLYDIYPEYKDTNNFFTVNGNKINKLKTIQENNIHNSDVIMLFPYEEE